MPGFPGLSLSVSIGGTRVAGSSSSEAVMRADQMMYMAKSHKNLVITDRFMLQNGKDGIARLEKEQVLQQILIVDDSDMNRAMLREILKDNYSILEAGNGAECLSCVEHMGTSLSLILLDLNMPEMDGFEVLAELSRLGYMDDIPVIIISGTDSTADICRAYDLGATDYIHRPFNTQVIYRRVSNTITLMAKQRRMAELVNRQIDRTTKQQELMVDFLSRIIGYRSGESNPHLPTSASSLPCCCRLCKSGRITMASPSMIASLLPPPPSFTMWARSAFPSPFSSSPESSPPRSLR